MTTLNHSVKHIILLISISCFICIPLYALEPREILVLANGKDSSSQNLAQFYMNRRDVPADNLLLLNVTSQEICSRSEYQKNVVTPVQHYLDKASHIRCILILYGLPLKIQPPPYSEDESHELHVFSEKIETIEWELRNKQPGNPDDLKKELKSLKTRLSAMYFRLDRASSLDSELMLVKKAGYPLENWLLNPYYQRNKNKMNVLRREDVIMVSRLDASSPEIVRRMITDSLKTEKKGLHGTAYFDARWSHNPENDSLSAYQRVDQSLHTASEDLKQTGKLKVILDSEETLFKESACPDTALYCGWYSLGRYIDSFTWKPGSLGYHIASSECVTLKKKEATTWCKQMLDRGAAATLGPVGEPYVQAFPLPELFFKHVTEGYFSLAECYLISIPHVSWKMVLLGDPLYRPFR